MDRHPTHAGCHFAVGQALLGLGRAADAVGSLHTAVQVRDERSLPPLADYTGALVHAFEEVAFVFLIFLIVGLLHSLKMQRERNVNLVF